MKVDYQFSNQKFLKLSIRNLSTVQYLTKIFQNIHNIQVFVYIHRKSQRSPSLDLKQCLHNTRDKNFIPSRDLFTTRSVTKSVKYLTEYVGNVYHRP